MPLNSILCQPLVAPSGQEEQLRVFAATLDTFPVACFMVDTAHRVVHWNRACEILTGVAASDIVGTATQGEVFYACQRMVMADLIVAGATDPQVDSLYHGKFRPSVLIPGTYEAEDFFPHFGADGRWLYFTAAPVYDVNGILVGAIETLQDITERRRAEEALKASEERFKVLSRTDPLTQLFNLRYFYEQLDNEMARAERYPHPLSLMIIDVDHFKQVNDCHGHLEGDRILRLVAEEITTSKRRSDAAFRYGGDEFVVILPATEQSEAAVAANRLRECWSGRPTQLAAGGTLGCTLSIGIAQYVPHESPQQFIRRADAAAYEAKRLGRNRTAVEPPAEISELQ